MASLTRLQVRQFSNKYLNLFKHSNNFKNRHKVLFHWTSYLNVKGQPIKMPSLSPTMSEGTIVKWMKKEGDVIQPGDVLCDIQTDKAVVSMEIEEEGILAKIIVKEDTKEVKVGTLIALMVNEGEDWKDVEYDASADEEAGGGGVQQEEKKPVPESVASSSQPGDLSQKEVGSYGPAVRTLLEIYQLQPSQIKGSWRKSRILKEDVMKYVTENKLQPKTPKTIPLPSQKKTLSIPQTKRALSVEQTASYVDRPLTTMRQVIAKRLSESKRNIPHSYATMKCNLDRVIQIRKGLKSQGIRVSINDFIIKAVAAALYKCPAINAVYVKDEVQHVKEVDISIAVATDNGLITPIIKDANNKSVTEISAEVRELGGRARENKLKPHEFQGGTFTISNLGMFGIKEFTAIINPPQCGILAVGCGYQYLNKDMVTVWSVMVTLSYDRRAVDEFEAAHFLEVLRTLLENPSLIVLGVSEFKAAESSKPTPKKTI